MPPLRIDSVALARTIGTTPRRSNLVLRGAAGFGKTSWLVDYSAAVTAAPEAFLGAPRVRSVLLNAPSFATTESISVAESFKRMCGRLLDGLGRDPTRARALPWESRLPSVLFRYTIEQELQEGDPDGHILLAFDDIDGLRKSRNAVDLFDTLRGLGEDNYDEPFSRLRIVVATSIPLNELGTALSSLNHWPEVVLAPYTDLELEGALARPGIPPPGARHIEHLQRALGGHPKLLQIAQAETDASVDALLAWCEQGEQSAGVQRWFDAARRYLLGSERCASAARLLLRGEPIENAIAKELVRFGLVLRAPGQRDDAPWQVSPIGEVLARWLARQVG